jgi:hypothetical protein
METSTIGTNEGNKFLKTGGNFLKSIAVALSVSVLLAVAAVRMWERPYSTDRLIDFLTFRYSWPQWNYDATFSLKAELIPVITSVITIAILGRSIERASTLRQWILTSILVVFTATATICTMAFPLITAIFSGQVILESPPLKFWYYFITFCSGFVIVTLVHPRSQNLRLLVASLMAAAIGGVLELFMLAMLLIGW